MEQARLTVYFDDPFRAGLFGLHGETGFPSARSQQALHWQREEMKAEQTEKTREQMEAEKERLFKLRQLKRRGH